MPLVFLSLCGQILYGIGLTATLNRGDLSAYYPIIRASPDSLNACALLGDRCLSAP